MGSHFFLKSDRIGLRSLSLADLDGPYVDWFNDPEVCLYNSHHCFPMGREEAEKFIRDSQSNRSQLVLAVEALATGKHIGNLSLQKINFVDRNAEFAILMGDKQCWGQGFAKEASVLLLRHGFLALNLHRVYCGTNSENLAMQRLADFLGMQNEGSYREAQYKNGHYRDIKRYAVLAADFLEKFSEG